MHLPNFSPTPDNRFDLAVIEVANGSWQKFRNKTSASPNRMEGWRVVLPFPEQAEGDMPYFMDTTTAYPAGRVFGAAADVQKTESPAKRVPKKFYRTPVNPREPFLTGEELEKACLSEWKRQASDFVLSCRTRIDEQLLDLAREIGESLRVHEQAQNIRSGIGIDALLDQWIKSNTDMSLMEFCRMRITRQTVGVFVGSAVIRWINANGVQQVVPAIPAPPAPVEGGKRKRVNEEAQEKRTLLFAAYDRHIRNGFTKPAAITKLVIDFKQEYNPFNATNRKKCIQKIIRERPE